MVGKDIVTGNTSLFNQPITVADIRHAKALHAHQDKGYRFNNKIK
jgi:hypothetical protein